MIHSSFSANSAPEGGGGAIDNFVGRMTVSLSTFSGNNSSSAFGGGVLNDGSLTLSQSTLSGNSSIAGGGAIENQAQLSVTDSAFLGNRSIAGGGIEGTFGSLNIVNSTFSANTSIYGAAIENLGATMTITSSTLSANRSYTGEGGGIQNAGPSLTSLKSTILAGNLGGGCAGLIADAGYNIADDATCKLNAIGSVNNGDPQLSSAGVQDNGGPTPTIALESGSPAIDVIPLAACTNQASPPGRITTDQRGFRRPDHHETVCDIGAYESRPSSQAFGSAGAAGQSALRLDRKDAPAGG